MNNPFVKFSLLLGAVILLAFGCNRTTPNVTPPVVVIPPPIVVPPPPPPKPDYTTASGKKPQFVVVAFDGSYSLSMWEKTLDFAQQMNQEQRPIHFTYFLSGVYFLNYRKAAKYLPPLKPAGTSSIGFADSNLDVEKRVSFVNRAIAEQHEIGSHANGHFDGSGWSEADWNQELSQFNNLIFNLAQNNDVTEPDIARYTINLKPADLVGFRAPDLGKGSNLVNALAGNGYQYDTSFTGKSTNWPSKLAAGVWEFPVASIQYANTSSYLLAMDYNFYYKQSKAVDVAKKGDEQWAKFYNDTKASYLNYFQKNYDGTRAPVYIASHFSEWNDGVYWEVTRDFASEVCGQSEVYCVTFKELMNYLNDNQIK